MPFTDARRATRGRIGRRTVPYHRKCRHLQTLNEEPKPSRQQDAVVCHTGGIVVREDSRSLLQHSNVNLIFKQY
jgi:hypothetical protein